MSLPTFRRRNPAGLWWLILLASLAAVAGALVSQHRFGMQPCPWCVLQRLIFLALAATAALGLIWRRGAGPLLATLGAVVLSLAGAAAALWQHFVAAKSASCALTLADRILSGLKLDVTWPEVFEPRASCAESTAALLGLPYEFWSLGLYLMLAALALAAWRRAHSGLRA